jgi:glycosidase
VWPAELQDPGTFTAKGRITNWDWYPEYLEGDFEGLKDIALGSGPADGYRPSPALRALTRVYQYWIAFADLDGFRVDTVKHMDPGQPGTSPRPSTSSHSRSARRTST